MQIKVNKRDGKFYVVVNCRSGVKYISPFGYAVRKDAAAKAKMLRGVSNLFKYTRYFSWKTEFQTF